MKKLSISVLCVITSGLTACATPPVAKMTLHICDAETGNPVDQVAVRTQFKPNKNKRLVSKIMYSDTNGVCVVEGPINYVNMASGITKIGYYKSQAQLDFKGQNKILNRWEPWNPTLEVKLRPIKNPVSMVHKYIEWNVKIPVFNKPVGFDLEVGDWVAPYGKGKVSDFVFTAYEKITGAKVELGYSLNFSNKLDGIQEYLIDKKRNSSFILPYKAPEQNYDSGLKKYLTSTGNIDVKTNLKMYNNDVYYIFRVRTSKDKDGNICANYGYIKRELEITSKGKFKFEYWLNTNSTSRSLEWIGNVPHDQRKNYK